MNQVNYDLLYEVYAASGLGKWFKERWVDLSRKKKGGGHPPCGASAGKGVRKKSKSKKYPKCVPASRAAGMSKKQKASAVRRKRAAGNKGKKPNWVSTKPLKEVFIATENNMKVNELLKFLNEEAKPSKKMVEENNIVETIRALVLEELTREAAGPTGTTGAAPAPGAAAAAPPADAFPTPPPTAGQPVAAPASTPAPSASGAAAKPAAGQTTPAAPGAPRDAPVSEVKTLEEELDEAFGLKEDSYSPNFDGGNNLECADGSTPSGNVTPMAPVEELEESDSGHENELEENLFAEGAGSRGRVLSESVKNGELLMQERRRKQLIQVQNKILYSKR